MAGVMGMDQEKDEVGPRTWGPIRPNALQAAALGFQGPRHT